VSGPAAQPFPPAWAGLVDEYLAAEAGAGRSPATNATRRGHLAYMARGLRLCAVERHDGRDPCVVRPADVEHRNAPQPPQHCRVFLRVGAPRRPPSDEPSCRASDDASGGAGAAAGARFGVVRSDRQRGPESSADVAPCRRSWFAARGDCPRASPRRHPRAGRRELLVHGKGGKLRVVPIGDGLSAAIAAASTRSVRDSVRRKRIAHYRVLPTFGPPLASPGAGRIPSTAARLTRCVGRHRLR
jgi:integrase/recombinase XerC